MSLLSNDWVLLTAAYPGGVAIQRGWTHLALDVALLCTAAAALVRRATRDGAPSTPLPPALRALLRAAVVGVAAAAVGAAALALTGGGDDAVGYPLLHVAAVAVWACVAVATAAPPGVAAAVVLALCAAELAHSAAVRGGAGGGSDGDSCAAPSLVATDAVAAACLAVVAATAAAAAWRVRAESRVPPPAPAPDAAAPVAAYRLAPTRARAAGAAYDAASAVSRATYAYLDPLFATGLTRQLDMGDVDPLPAALDTRAAAAAFEAGLAALRRGLDAAAADARDGGADGATLPSPRRPARALLALLLRLHGWAWAGLGGLQALNTALSFAGPLILNRVLAFLQARGGVAGGGVARGGVAGGGGAWAGLGWAALMAAQALVSAALSARFNFVALGVQVRLRAGLTAAVVSTVLAAPPDRPDRAAALSPGAVTNFVSVDVQRVQDAVTSTHQLWALPVQVAVTLYLLYTQVSWAFGAGLLVIVVFVPVNAAISTRIGALTATMMSARDERVRVTGETLGAIRVVKAMAWEAPLGARIRAARALEVAALTQRKYLDAACVYLWAATPVLVAVATFGAVVALAPGDDSGGGAGGSLSAAAVFTTLSLLNMLIFPLNALSWIVAGTLEAGVSLGRLARLLCAHVDPALMPRRDRADAREKADDAPRTMEESEPAGAALFEIDGTFEFAGAPDEPDGSAGGGAGGRASTHAVGPPFWLSLTVPSPPCRAAAASHAAARVSLRAGELLVVAGPIGAGKSAFLAAMLGEMVRGRGGAAPGAAAPRAVRCSTAYAPQTPWVRGASLRHNIVGGLPWDAGRYAAVLHACALEPDVRTLADGDATVVRRTTLSGGQQARVGLARALYDASALVLLDEPLAALDARVATTVWRRALAPGGASLLSRERRAAVLVTHDPRLLGAGDALLLLHGGAIVYYGPPAEAPPALMVAAGAAVWPPAPAAAMGATGADADDDDGGAGTVGAGDGKASSGGTDTAPAADGAGGVGEEERAVGTIRGRVVRTYAALAGGGLVAAVLASLAAMQLTRNGSDWWLSVWSAVATSQAGGDGGGGGGGGAAAALLPLLAAWPPARFLAVFAGIAAANSASTAARAVLFAAAGLRACVATHDRMLAAVLAAPLAFHDAHPLGRLLNRFSADAFALDESLPFQLNILLAQAFGLAGTAVVLTYATEGVFLLAAPPLALVYASLQRTYRASSRELKRLDSVTRSPLFSHLCDVIEGAAVVRAATPSRAAARAAATIEAAESAALLDDNQRTSFASSVTPQWLGLRLQALGALVLAVVAFAAVATRLFMDAGAAAQGDDAGCAPAAEPPAAGSDGGGIGAAAGLALSYAIPIVGALQGIMGAFTETEKEFISVERVREYLDVPPEEEAGEEEGDSRDGGDDAHGGATVAPAKGAAARGAAGGADMEAPLLWSDGDAAPVSHSARPHARRRAAPPPMAGTAAPWVPASGAIVFDHVTVRYPGTTRPALADFCLSCRPGDVVGLVGRTGSGKSTALLALLRLVPVAPGGGRITVGGVDTRDVPRADLRRAVAVIPQAPVLLKGSVRFNLDPASEHGDDALRGVLQRCRLTAPPRAQGAAPAAAAPERFGLDAPVDEGGANFSAGERQLLCVARALLRRCAVVCVDEATSAADVATERLVTQLVADEFRGATVLIVAHRTATLAHCTRVVELAGGTVVREGTAADVLGVEGDGAPLV